MTTTVKRGTGRPAAAAKRTKAAQRSATAPVDNLGSMSLTELRQYALAQGWSTGTKGTKKEIIALLRKHPDGPPKSAKANGASKQAAPKVRSFRPITPGLGGSGEGKCACVAELLKAAGWKVKHSGTSLDASKGTAALRMVWSAKGAHNPADSWFQPDADAKPRRVTNVATMLRLARG